jgi:hypothetical protein
MSLFSKRIETKVDHLAVLHAAIGDALEAAQKASVPFAAILREMEARAAHLRNIETAEIEKRSRNPYPTMYDQQTLRPIDYAGKARRAEEARLARELREQQIAYAKSVDERGREDAVGEAGCDVRIHHLGCRRRRRLCRRRSSRHCARLVVGAVAEDNCISGACACTERHRCGWFEHQRRSDQR